MCERCWSWAILDRSRVPFGIQCVSAVRHLADTFELGAGNCGEWVYVYDRGFVRLAEGPPYIPDWCLVRGSCASLWLVRGCGVSLCAPLVRTALLGLNIDPVVEASGVRSNQPKPLYADKRCPSKGAFYHTEYQPIVFT